MSKKIIVLAKKHGPSPNVLFMMESSDFRLHDARFKDDYTEVTGGKLTTTKGTRDDGYTFRLFEGTNGKLYRVFHDWSAQEHTVPSATREIYVCTTCGGANIQRDAWVHVNDPEQVQTFDDTYCEDCDGSCNLKKVTVPDTFDIYNDKYEEKEHAAAV